MKRQFLAVATVLISCSGPDPRVKPSASSQMGMPAYPSLEKSLRLSDQETAPTNFEGPIIFWSEKADPTLMSKVLTQSLDIKKADASFKELKFRRENLEKGMKGLEAELSALNSKIEGGVEQQIDGFLREQRGAIREKVLGEWTAKLSPGKAEAFESYCEGALWSFGSSELLRNYEFEQRPSAQDFCEAYYAKKGFFTDESCSIAEAGKTKSFFACYWGKSGVLKTSVAYLEAKRGTPPVSAAVKEEIESLLTSADWQSHFTFSPTTGFLDVKGKRIVLKLNGRLLKDVIKQSPADFVEGAEFAAQVSALTLDRRSKKNVPLTLSDRLFNIPLLGKDDAKRKDLFLSEDLYSLAKGALLAFGVDIPLEVYTNALEDLKKAQAEKQSKIDGIKQRTALISEFEMERYGAWLEAKLNSGWYILENKQAAALYPKTLITLQVKNQVAIVTLKMDYVSGELAQGCYSLRDYQPVICVGGPASVPMEVVLDPATSMLSLELPLQNPEGLGMKQVLGPSGESSSALPQGRGEPQYQEWESKTLKGKTLKIEVFPRQYSSALTILTGKIFLLEGSKVLSEGSVSLSEYGLGL